jgi:hypothetical protein
VVLWESVTVEVPVAVHALEPEVEFTFGAATTVMVAVLLALSEVEQLLELEMELTVIVEDPTVVKPVAVKVPVPFVETVSVAVFAVCAGELVLYVTE